ncbi:winged helix DNA-binding domain-containing protein [Streptomyces sp. b94]|uniref:winged helix DNA-binding domain-containing protein n=1 Tax=Streptomyces sp. b94 TaxID=1827634 RepID=UPI003F9289AA
MAAQTHRTAAHPARLTVRELNRATLERQLLLRRSSMSAREAVGHLVGLQAQNTKPPYFQLYARLADFDPAELSSLMESREVVRLVTLRSTLHTHTADDALTLGPLVRAPRDRELASFRHGLEGVDLDRLAALTQRLVEERPRPLKELRGELLAHWPAADPLALTVAARCLLPLVQVTPRGLWGRGGQVALTTVEHWLGRSAGPAPTLDTVVTRYLCVRPRLGQGLPELGGDHPDEGGVRTAQAPADHLPGRERRRTLRPSRRPAPRPDAPAPPRFLPEFDNVLLGHADRTRVIPAVNKGRNGKGNQTYGSVLIDGFLDALWQVRQEQDTAVLTVQPLRKPTRAQTAEITEEAARMLAVMSDAPDHDIRFGTFLDFGDRPPTDLS